jgi:hypothetical protein
MDAIDPQPQTLPDSDLVRMHLAFRDVPCPHCGYNLRGLAAAQCPECSTPLRLTIAPDDSATWPAGLAIAILVLHTVLLSLGAAAALANDSVGFALLSAGMAAAGLFALAHIGVDGVKATGPCAVRWALGLAIVDFVVVLVSAALPALALAR